MALILTILKLYNEARFFGYVADNSEEMEPDRIRPAILILPGGGYAMTSDREAEPVENALMLIQACRAAGVSIEAHLFPEGSHGLSLANAETAGNGFYAHIVECVQCWPDLAEAWLRRLF
ncbi:hypothetical protein [Bifidobacterium longum]|uniref:hypothetical protein n=1 Tax=Bifidobacterium longum TaxID=216816 RepID=UPI001C381B40|nr:hypothetical protein [uncultured Bifidobacterium sp.]MBV3097927.1 hypothetical protein [Bifidobacterium longum]MBV3114917.1 hypothetical protein [Bifidobacterium longum]